MKFLKSGKHFSVSFEGFEAWMEKGGGGGDNEKCLKWGGGDHKGIPSKQLKRGGLVKTEIVRWREGILKMSPPLLPLLPLLPLPPVKTLIVHQCCKVRQRGQLLCHKAGDPAHFTVFLFNQTLETSILTSKVSKDLVRINRHSSPHCHAFIFRL